MAARMGADSDLVRLKGIVKHFPGVLALNRVDFDVRRGEVHVLVGENGAGKSTLIKIISGAYRKDEGEIILEGKPVEIHSPRHAQHLGIATVYQEFNLVPFMSVAENIFLGRQLKKGRYVPILDRARMNKEARTLLEYLDLDINPRTLVRDLGVAQKQMVEIAKAFSVQAKLFILDEPTATLTFNETGRLFQLIERLKAEKLGIIYISHRLEEVFKVGDRITVMRNGEYVATRSVDEVATNDLVEMMIGRKIEETFRFSKRTIGPVLLETEDLSGKKFRDININVKEGEIVGLAGLVGAGRTEVLRGIFGADKVTAGSVYLKGNRLPASGPEHSVKKRIALLPEDRKKHGLISCRSVEENISISSLPHYCRFGMISKPKLFRRVRELVQKLAIKTPGLKQAVMYLSGGNQQKVIIARWLAADSDLILFDEPTRGIDVGAKQEVYSLMHEMAGSGKGIIVVSSEIPELLRTCDRIYVMHEGTIKAEFGNKDLSSEQILNAAFGRVAEAGA
jgi:ribose transport system ATP-binding protein